MMEIPGVAMARSGSALVVCFLALIVALPSVVTGQNLPASAVNPADLSGMFTFLKEGEFVQLTVEDGKLSGFISRFGDTDSDKGQFIDQFFDKTSLNGDHLYFKTKTVHALWYEFDGTLDVATGKHAGEEGYRVMRGKLTLHAADTKGAEHPSEKTVEFKSFPDMRRR
jgi:hypothetical protein